MPYYEPDSHKGAFGLVVAWTVGLVVLVALISAALWAGGVFTSNVKGAGDAIKQNNSVVNRVGKQEMFEQLYADINGYAAKIAVAKEAAKDAKGTADESIRNTELIGARQLCIDTVQQYNAESEKYTSRDWKSTGLPQAFDVEVCDQGR